MTAKVPQAVNQPTQKVYSKDKKIFLGMTVKDASKSTELMKIFDFADVDKNGEIDKGELERYNGPIIVHNVETKEARVLGKYYGFHSGIFEGEIIKKHEIDLYPGLTVEKVNDKGRIAFTQIDTNHDGKLSKEEITSATQDFQKLEQTKQKMKQAYEKAHKATRIGAGITLGTSVAAGVVGGIVCAEVLAGIVMGGVAFIPAAGAFFGYTYYRDCKLQDELEGLKSQFLNNVKSPYVKEIAIEEFNKLNYSVF